MSYDGNKESELLAKKHDADRFSKKYGYGSEFDTSRNMTQENEMFNKMVDNYGEVTSINKIRFKEWADAYLLYQRGKVAGYDSNSLRKLSNLLLGAHVIDINTTDIDTLYSGLIELLNAEIASQEIQRRI